MLFVGDAQVVLEKGTVAFGSGFTDGASKTWRDIYCNAKKNPRRTYSNLRNVTSPLWCASSQFIMGPVAQLMRETMNDAKDMDTMMLGHSTSF